MTQGAGIVRIGFWNLSDQLLLHHFLILLARSGAASWESPFIAELVLEPLIDFPCAGILIQCNVQAAHAKMQSSKCHQEPPRRVWRYADRFSVPVGQPVVNRQKEEYGIEYNAQQWDKVIFFHDEIDPCVVAQCWQVDFCWQYAPI